MLKLKHFILLCSVGSFLFPVTTFAEDNLSPVIESPTAEHVSLEFGQAYSEQIIATDPEEDPLVFSLIQSPPDASIDSISGLLIWDPPSDAYSNNPYVFEVQATDNISKPVSFQWELNILPPLVITSDLNKAKGILNHAHKSPKIYYEKSSDISLLPRKVEILDSDGGSNSFTDLKVSKGSNYYQISFVPTKVDDYSISIVIRGKSNKYDKQEYAVNAEYPLEVAPNSSPIVKSTPPSLAKSTQPYTYALNVHDADNDSMTYQLIEGPEGAVIDDTGLIQWTPSLSSVLDLTASFHILIDDQHGSQAHHQWEVLIADSFEPSNSVAHTTTICAFHDSPHHSLSDLITDLDRINPEACPFSNIHLANDPDFFLIPSEFLKSVSAKIIILDSRLQPIPDLSLSLVDIEGNPITNTTIEYLENEIRFLPIDIEYFLKVSSPTPVAYRPFLIYNQKPIVTFDPGKIEILENTSFSIHPLFSDPELQTLEYLLDPESVARGLIIDSNSGKISWNPGFDDAGEYVLTISAIEKHEHFLPNSSPALLSITLLVTNVNRSPVIEAVPNQSIKTEESFQYKLKGYDPDDSLLSYVLVGGPSEALLSSDRGILTWDSPTPGTHLFSVKVADPDGGFATISFQLAVPEEPKKAPPVSPRSSIRKNNPPADSSPSLIDKVKNTLIKPVQAAEPGIKQQVALIDPEEDVTESNPPEESQEEEQESSHAPQVLGAQDKNKFSNTWIIVSILLVVGAGGYITFYFTQPT